MSSISSSLWTKTVAVGVVAVAFVVGNAPLPASGRGASAGTSAVSALSGVPSRVDADISSASGAMSPLSGFGYSRFDSSASGIDGNALPQLPAQISDASASDEAGQIVPAIYSWDPDVRFVFYRHVSKWM